MLIATCPCGARYRVPATAAKRQARCKRCGATFTVPTAPDDDTFPLAAAADQEIEAGAAHLTQAATAGAAVVIAARTEPLAEPLALEYASAYSEDQGWAPGAWRQRWGGYLRGIADSARFCGDVGGFLTFIMFWVVLLLADWAQGLPRAGLLALALSSAWLMSYQLNVVIGAAGNEDRMPDIDFAGNWIDDVILPLYKMLLTRLIAHSFAAAFLLSIAIQAGAPALAYMNMFAVLFGNFVPIVGLPPMEQTIAWLLVLTGYLIWPMLVLVVAIGGPGALVRLDLMAITIFRTFAGYLAAAICVYLGELIAVAAELAAAAGWLEQVMGPQSGVTPATLKIALIGVRLYLSLLGMRALGLYYHYFKGRFAWSWG